MATEILFKKQLFYSKHRPIFQSSPLIIKLKKSTKLYQCASCNSKIIEILPIGSCYTFESKVSDLEAHSFEHFFHIIHIDLANQKLVDGYILEDVTTCEVIQSKNYLKIN